LRWADLSWLGPPRWLLNDQIRLQRACGLYRLKDRNDPRRLDADPVQTADQRSQAQSADNGDRSSSLLDIDPGVGRDAVLPYENGAGWETRGCSATRTVSVP
jgi:hypothetical protein